MSNLIEFEISVHCISEEEAETLNEALNLLLKHIPVSELLGIAHFIDQNPAQARAMVSQIATQ